MSLSSQVRFSFKNLEPINYLKAFNRMIDYQSRTPDLHPSAHKNSPQKQLRVVSLSKFPTPTSYEHMQGIFQNVSKKKVEQDMNKYSKEIEEEEKFMKKHNDFMRKVLERFIEHNKERQNAYEKQKVFYKKDFKGKHLRAVSQPRLDKVRDEKVKEKDKERTAEPSKTDNKATIGSEVGLEEMQEEQSCEVLPKLQPRKKKQKVNLKKEKDIENYVVNRKLNNSRPSPNPQAAPLYSSRMHLPVQEQDEPLDFKQQIVSLQRKQAKIQTDFSSRIERQIAQFGRKMSTQVHAINYFNFWKEPKQDQSEEERERKIKKMREQAQQRQERVDFQVNFRNYQST